MNVQSKIQATEVDADAMEATLVAIGLRIRKARQARSMTLRALADQSGVSTSMLSLVERGRVSPSLGSLIIISEALGVAMSDLIVDESAKDDDVVVHSADRRLVEHAKRVVRRRNLPLCESAAVTICQKPQSFSKYRCKDAGNSEFARTRSPLRQDSDPRCQRISVPGLMIGKAPRTPRFQRYNTANTRRPMLPRAGRFGELGRRILSWWRSARFSAASEARDRNRPPSAYQISLQRLHIGQKHHSIAVPTCRFKFAVGTDFHQVQKLAEICTSLGGIWAQ